MATQRITALVNTRHNIDSGMVKHKLSAVGEVAVDAGGIEHAALHGDFGGGGGGAAHDEALVEIAEIKLAAVDHEDFGANNSASVPIEGEGGTVGALALIRHAVDNHLHAVQRERTGVLDGENGGVLIVRILHGDIDRAGALDHHFARDGQAQALHSRLVDKQVDGAAGGCNGPKSLLNGRICGGRVADGGRSHIGIVGHFVVAEVADAPGQRAGSLVIGHGVELDGALVAQIVDNGGVFLARTVVDRNGDAAGALGEDIVARFVLGGKGVDQLAAVWLSLIRNRDGQRDGGEGFGHGAPGVAVDAQRGHVGLDVNGFHRAALDGGHRIGGNGHGRGGDGVILRTLRTGGDGDFHSGLVGHNAITGLVSGKAAAHTGGGIASIGFGLGHQAFGLNNSPGSVFVISIDIIRREIVLHVLSRKGAAQHGKGGLLFALNRISAILRAIHLNRAFNQVFLAVFDGQCGSFVAIRVVEPVHQINRSEVLVASTDVDIAKHHIAIVGRNEIPRHIRPNQSKVFQRQIAVVLNQHQALFAVLSNLDGAVFQLHSVALFQMEALRFGSGRASGRVVAGIGEPAEVNGQIDPRSTLVHKKAHGRAFTVLAQRDFSGLVLRLDHGVHCTGQRGILQTVIGLGNDQLFGQLAGDLDILAFQKVVVLVIPFQQQGIHSAAREERERRPAIFAEALGNGIPRLVLPGGQEGGIDVIHVLRVAFKVLLERDSALRHLHIQADIGIGLIAALARILLPVLAFHGVDGVSNGAVVGRFHRGVLHHREAHALHRHGLKGLCGFAFAKREIFRRKRRNRQQRQEHAQAQQDRQYFPFHWLWFTP